jgi:hypothetical protein
LLAVQAVRVIAQPDANLAGRLLERVEVADQAFERAFLPDRFACVTLI